MTNKIDYVTTSDQLQFKSGPFPSVIQKQWGDNDMASVSQWITTNLDELEQQLRYSGALLFRGFPVDSAESFDAFSASFGYASFTYQESLSNAVRINFTERVFTANEAPKEVEIYLHHEMAQTPLSPDKLFFFCKAAAETGGATPLCRSDQLFSALLECEPKLANKFKDQGLRYTTTMPDQDDHDSGQGRSWRSTLSAISQEKAEEKLNELGYSWSWGEDGSLKAITPVLPAVRTLKNGIDVFYNQLIAAYLGWDGVKEDPSSAIKFGDGSKIPVSILETIVALSKEFTYDLKWQDGDVALIDNRMTMHGRRPFAGERKRQVLVALAA